MPMTDDAFAGLVAEEVKDKVTASQRAYLELPENWNRWRRALEVLSKNLEDQIIRHDDRVRGDTRRYEALGADGVELLTQHLTESDTQRKKIARFKLFVDERLVTVVRKIELSQGISRPTEREGVVEFLTQAIKRHQEMILDGGFDEPEVDEALWAALNGKWEFDGVPSAAPED